MNKKIFFLIFIILLLMGVLFLFSYKSHDSSSGVYVYEFDTNSPETETGGIVIYKVVDRVPQHYFSISGVTLYVILNKDNKYNYDQLWRVLDSSMIKENIGSIIYNHYISGKFVDPDTRNQIGHWTYDLDKKDFKEVVLNLPSK